MAYTPTMFQQNSPSGQAQKQSPGTGVNPKQIYDMAKNFNDQPTGQIVGAEGGAPILSGAEAGGGGAAAAGGLAAAAEEALPLAAAAIL